MQHVMIDLETYGTKPGSVILSIGAVPFANAGIGGPEFYGVISLPNSVADGFAVSADTVAWWDKQSAEAKSLLDVAKSPQCPPARQILGEFSEYLQRFDKPGIWGFGATFDNVLLRAAYEHLRLPCPWGYRQDRCYRTLAALVEHGVAVPVRTGVHHNALDDARYQAQCASLALQFLGL